MPLGSQSDLARGDKVIAFGFPGSLATAFNPTANVGIVSVSRTRSVPLGYTAALPDVIQTDVAHNPGNSGGPLVNRRGQLVGMTTFSNRQLEGQRYAIGVDRVKVIVPDLVAGRSIGWAGLGWDVELPPDVLAQLGLNGAAGLPILDATPGTGAADAHVPTPSLLVRVQGKPVTADVGDYCRLVGNARAGDTARLTFLPANSDQPVDVNVTFR